MPSWKARVIAEAESTTNTCKPTRTPNSQVDDQINAKEEAQSIVAYWRRRKASWRTRYLEKIWHSCP